MNNDGKVAYSDRSRIRRFSDKKTIRQRLAEWLTKKDTLEEYDAHEIRAVIPSEQLNVEPIRLNIYVASGGYIVETRVHDQNNHHRDYEYRLHIIGDTDGMDLGTELSKILTLDSLRG